MNSIQTIAEQAARSAAQLIKRAAHDIGVLNVEQKSLHDYVSEVDRGAEKIIVSEILKAFPDHQVLGEEYGIQSNTLRAKASSGAGGPLNAEGSAKYRWVIDPLDGTTNFLRGIPHYAISIGVFEGSDLIHAVVLDVAKDEFFSATKGQGAFLNGCVIRVSERATVNGALLATGVPFSGENLAQINSFTNTMVDLLQLQTSGIRRLGAAALDLAYVAAGRYDGFWEANLQVWDIAAGVLLVQEAGGRIGDLSGGVNYLETGNIVAANRGVYEDIIRVTSACYKD